MTVQDAYPITSMDKFVDRIEQTQNFRYSDSNSAEKQVSIAPKYKDNMRLTTYFGTYALTRMPIGPMKEPVTYQGAI